MICLVDGCRCLGYEWNGDEVAETRTCVCGDVENEHGDPEEGDG